MLNRTVKMTWGHGHPTTRKRIHFKSTIIGVTIMLTGNSTRQLIIDHHHVKKRHIDLYYNRKQLHLKLDYMSPEAFELQNVV